MASPIPEFEGLDPEALKKFKDELNSPKRARAVMKRKITIVLNKLKDAYDNSNLTSSLLKLQGSEVEKLLEQVNNLDEKILSIFYKFNIDVVDESYYDSEIELHSTYRFNVFEKLDEFSTLLEPSNPGNTSNSAGMSSEISEQILANLNKVAFNEGKPPPLQCGTFDGSGVDKFEFHVFLNQFKNVIDHRKDLSNSAKLAYLQSYLRGYAFKIIKHLSINNDNYPIALDLLKSEFYDESYLIEEMYKKLISLNPSFDQSFNTTRVYINEVRSIVYELKNFNLDFLENDSPGCSLLSHIIFNKLPNPLKRELVHKVDNNYPSLNNIFEFYNEALKTILKTTKIKVPEQANSKQTFKKTKFPFSNSGKSVDSVGEAKLSTLQNFKVGNMTKESNSSDFISNKPCKFCGTSGHSMNKCNTYKDHDSRIKRCSELSLCSLCSSNKHTSNCPSKLDFQCLYCKQKTHITALCPNKTINDQIKPSNNIASLCLNFSQKTDKLYLLPSLTLTFLKGQSSVKVRSLLDTGSQRSYISSRVAKSLCSYIEELEPIKFNIQTFIGTEERKFKQISLSVKIENQHPINMPLLIDDSLCLKYEVSEMNSALTNLVKNGYDLADSSFNLGGDNTVIEMDALIGTDLLQFFPSFALNSCMNGNCFMINNKCIPFGNIQHFLYRDQIELIYKVEQENLDVQTHVSIVNQILEPVKSYFNPIETILSDSDIDNGLENLFSIESIGIKSGNEDLSSIDKDQVQNFEENIVFKDNHYHVSLPWYDDKINLVSSNYQIALRVLDRVISNLTAKYLFDQYDKVFKQYLADNIIEKIDIHPSAYDNYIWIPHRAVIKMQDQVTTKIRPVFNCSLKIDKHSPSLNEAAYTGIDLMSSLLKLLLLFRTNQYVLMSDIKQAFLMIKLKTEFDRNKFCFFWKENDEIVAYRYTSLVFGFTSSPFILHYVMKHHVAKYPMDKCSQILCDNFYVDNLILTGNDLRELEDLYKTSYERMAEGGFILRSWNTNSNELKTILEHDQNMVEHGSVEEKVLGYIYNTVTDTFRISEIDYNLNANTKRQILSETSKLFDPLSIVLPITIRGKLLMRHLWMTKLGWDEEVSVDIKSQWIKLAKDYKIIPEISFPRQALNIEDKYGLHVFCDSSQNCYGFVVYACSETSSNFIFSKAKVAPIKTYSIPNLELLSVVLAIKCLPTILSSYLNIEFKFINICVDAQVVLSWILTQNLKTKSKFVKNRIDSIHMAKDEISKEYKLPLYFRYVETAENPADLLTRGMSTSLFINKMKTWLKGPKWLSNDFDKWPQYKLLSIPPEVVSLTSVNVGFVSHSTVLDVSKYSNLNKLLRITSYLFKFYKMSFKINLNPDKCALKYWIKQMQLECFSNELKFIESNGKSKIEPFPVLVNNLNLFIDDLGILRTRGRVSRNIYFEFEVNNPILLSKNHHLTSLIIEDAHNKIQHLGLQSTLNYIRTKGYWIPKARQSIKKVISSCIICKRINSFSFKYPKLTNMPKNTMNFVKPFLHTGIDFTGHIWVKNSGDDNCSKMYILIFTCLNVRSVHLELVPDMSTKNFLLAFQRFSNNYLIPSYIYSDNARSFIQGGDILSKSLSSEEFLENLRVNNIQHIKIPLYSAWVGAAWERLIRVVKSCMYKVIGRAKLTYFELLTSLSNIQNAVNSRPLTYRSSENELEIITPNSFIKLHGNSALILADDSNVWVDDTSQKRLTDTLEKQEEAFEHFRKLWHETYLLSLREHSRNLYQSHWSNRIKVGDIVLIKNPLKPRPYWLLGRVLEIIIGFDNIIRSVKLKQGDGQIAHHSINHLYPMELSITHSPKLTDVDNLENDEIVDQEDKHDPNEIKRPVRQAARKCRKFIQDNLGNL